MKIGAKALVEVLYPGHAGEVVTIIRGLRCMPAGYRRVRFSDGAILLVHESSMKAL